MQLIIMQLISLIMKYFKNIVFISFLNYLKNLIFCHAISYEKLSILNNEVTWNTSNQFKLLRIFKKRLENSNYWFKA